MTPVLKDLHWLPVKQHIEYKVALVTHKVLETSQPGAELLFLPRSGRCCALLSPAAALLGQLMRG